MRAEHFYMTVSTCCYLAIIAIDVALSRYVVMLYGVNARPVFMSVALILTVVFWIFALRSGIGYKAERDLLELDVDFNPEDEDDEKR